jgi:hypothetical protein
VEATRTTRTMGARRGGSRRPKRGSPRYVPACSAPGRRSRNRQVGTERECVERRLLLANRETGRRTQALRRRATTDVRGCGRGRPRASQSASTRKSGGATVIRCARNRPTTTRASDPTTEFVRASAVATRAAAASDSWPRAHSVASTRCHQRDADNDNEQTSVCQIAHREPNS